MADQAQPSRAALEAALVAQAGFTRYQLAQREARNALRNHNRAHPLEFDESGFPIKQERLSFAARVARLLSPF
jgi:hypothetical protein